MSTSPTPRSFIGIPTRLRQWNDLLNIMKWQLMCDLRVAMPGIIQAFDPVKQTVDVQPAIMEMISLNVVTTAVPIAKLSQVPIMLPRAGNVVLTLPITAGDECLLLSADMCIDAWWKSGGVQKQKRKRRHDLSDCFAILAPWSQPKAISSYATSTAQLRSLDGTVLVEVDPTGTVNITAPHVNVSGATQVNVTSSTKVNINGSGHTTIEGKDFLTHQHTGVTTGGGDSGPVL